MAKIENKTTKKYADILKSGKIGEQELISFRSYLNSGKISNDDRDLLLEMVYKKPIKLTQDQQKKGIEWLEKQYKTPSGKLKDKSPFGYRETHVIQNWKDIELYSLENFSTFGFFYSPVFRVNSKDGNNFDYTLQGGRVKIVG